MTTAQPGSGGSDPGPSSGPSSGGSGRAVGRGLAGAALLIGALTVGARIAGVGRQFAFSASVGTGCTGTAYAAANTLPNVVFEVAAGGALAGAVVPVLAGLLSTDRRADADRAASALLTWVVLGLLPVAGLLAAAAAPLGRILVGGQVATDCGDVEALAALAGRMVLVFAPQVVLYGVGIVLTGVLQAHHRFSGPALAPMLSSLVVIGAYLAFGALPEHGDAAGLPGRTAELVLTGGTTLGVAALSLPLLVPVVAAGVRLRPALRFPPGTTARLWALAFAGLGVLLAQQAAVLVTIGLAGRVGGEGALVVVQYAQAVYLLPYAVLAVPVATAAFPRLSEHAARARTGAFAGAAASSTRIVVAVSLLGTAVLAAAASAVQALFVAVDAGRGQALGTLAEGVTWFAAGLLGWGLVAHLPRVLYALGRPRPAAFATAAGWVAAVASCLVAVPVLRAAGMRPDRAAVVGIAAGTSAGMLLAGGLLLLAVRAAAGRAAVVGVGRAVAVGGVGAVAGAVAGRGIAAPLLPDGTGEGGLAARGAGPALAALGSGLVVALAALVGFAVVAWLAEPGPRKPRAVAGGAAGEVAGGAAGGQRDEEAGEVMPSVVQVLGTSGGGVGRHVAALTGWLAGAGVSVRVAGPVATDAGFGFSAAGAGFIPVEIADRPHPLPDLRTVVRLRGLAADADVLHAHGLRAGALAVLAARSRRRRARVVVTLHNALVGGRGIAAVHAGLARIVARGADAVLVVSGDLGEQARRLGARQVGRALVPAPERPVTADPAATRAVLGVGQGERLLVTVARLAPQKGLPLLLDALAELVGAGAGAAGVPVRGVPVRAVLVGDGPLRDELADQAARRGLPLTLLGRRDDVPDLLAAADVVVVPSVWEGQPLIVQEALRVPAAIVATDVGGVRELAGDGAALVPPGRPGELAAVVAGLLTDTDARAALRERAAARARELPTDGDAGRQVVAVYRAVLARRPIGWACGQRCGPGPAAGGRADSLKARGAADS